MLQIPLPTAPRANRSAPLLRTHTRRRSSVVSGGLARLLGPILGLALLLVPTAGATILKTTATAFTGDPLTVQVEIDDETSPGDLVLTLSVEDGDLGDLRGFFAEVNDESLLPGLSASGETVTGSLFEADAITNLGRGANLNGGGSPCPCDLGIELGRPGIGGGDDFREVSFTLTHSSAALSVDLLRGGAFGVRVTSVGSHREGSSKLVGVVPEPSTAILLALGLGGLAARGRSGRVG